MSNEKLDPWRAVRVVRAKANEMEAQRLADRVD